jgi:tetratricopeptide repeat protein
MFRAGIRTLFVFSLFAVLTACSRFPDPDELARRNEDVTEQVNVHAAAVRGRGLASSRAAIDLTLREIRNRYGERSTEVPQAYSDAAMLVYREATASDALEYTRGWLDACRIAYGPEHRETAYALTDHARMQGLAVADGYAPEATALYRESLAVRRHILGADHPETAGSERFVAEQSLAICKHERHCGRDDPLLVEAEALTGHSLRVLRAAYGASHYEVGELEDLLRHIRRTRQISAYATDRDPDTPGSVSPTR